MNTKTTVVYHSADFDGLFCREIAKKFLPDAELIGWDFKDAPLKIPDGQIYIFDLPIDRVFGWTYENRPDGETMIKFQSSSNNEHFLRSHNPFDFMDRVIWIDHHKTSIDTHPTSLPGYRIDGVAACRLAWQWFMMLQGKHDGDIRANISGVDVVNFSLPSKQDFIDRNVSEPLAVRLAGEYDIWDKRDPRAELFQHGLRTVDLNESRWWVWFFEHTNDNCVNDLLERGRTVQFVRANEYADVITQQGFDIEFEGLKFLACNSHELDIRSHLFEAGITPDHDALLGFTYNGKSKDWRVSMYHAPGHEQHDLSAIAKKYGGGGHRGACGFRMAQLPFLT